MPKFVNPGAEEAFREAYEATVEERVAYAGDCLILVLPPEKKGRVTWRTLANKAEAAAQSNGVAEEANGFFVKHSMATYILGNNHASIKDYVEREQSILLDSRPFEGTCRGTRSTYAQTHTMKLRGVQSMAQHLTLVAQIDAARTHPIGLPSIGIRLLPPPQI